MSKSQKAAAASIADVQLSQNGEDELQSQPQFTAETMHSFLAQQDAVEPQAEYRIFKLINNNKRGRVHIDGIDDVYNPATKKVERVRLVSGVNSIWLKDQKDLTEDYVRQNRRTLIFEDKVLRVPSWDSTAIEFIEVSRHLVDNPNRKTGSKTEFYEWNPQKQAELALKQRHQKVEAMKLAMTVSEDKMRKHALFLGVNFVDELGLPKTPDSLRNDYVLKAEENPSNFMETVESPLVHVSFLVKKAIIDAKIDVGRESGKAYWSTGGFICSIPSHMKPQAYLVEFATSGTRESKEFLEQLEIVVKK